MSAPRQKRLKKLLYQRRPNRYQRRRLKFGPIPSKMLIFKVAVNFQELSAAAQRMNKSLEEFLALLPVQSQRDPETAEAI